MVPYYIHFLFCHFFIQVKPMVSDKEQTRLPETVKLLATADNLTLEKEKSTLKLPATHSTSNIAVTDKKSETDLSDTKKSFQLPPLVWDRSIFSTPISFYLACVSRISCFYGREWLKCVHINFDIFKSETCSHKMSDKIRQGTKGNTTHWTCQKSKENKGMLKEIMVLHPK